MRPYWEQIIYKVVKRKGGDIVRKVGRPAERVRIVHKNLLLICNNLPLDKTAPVESRTTEQVKERDTEQDKRPMTENGNDAQEQEKEKVDYRELNPKQLKALQFYSSTKKM